MTQTYTRPERRLLPEPTSESRAFWTGGKDGQLLICRCRACGRWFHPPAPVCFRCRSTDVGPEQASGLGRVAAFTVNRQPWISGLEPPYVVAMIEIAEDPEVRIVSNVVDVPVDEVRVGTVVEVFFEEWGTEGDDPVWLPLFRPAGAGAR